MKTVKLFIDNLGESFLIIYRQKHAHFLIEKTVNRLSWIGVVCRQTKYRHLQMLVSREIEICV